MTTPTAMTTAPSMLRSVVIGAAALCAGCQNAPTSYELVRGDPDQFQVQYAECKRLEFDYLFTYESNPLDPVTPFDKCMRERGFVLNRPR